MERAKRLYRNNCKIKTRTFKYNWIDSRRCTINKKNFLRELKEKVEELDIRKNILFIEHRSDLREIMSISKLYFLVNRARSFWKDYY